MTNKQQQSVDLNNELVLYRLDQIDRKLDEQNKNFVTKTEFKDAIKSLEEDVASLRKQKTLLGTVVPAIVGIVTAVFTALIVFGLTRK